MKTYIYIVIPLLIALAIFHPLALADDDDGCSYDNGCLANPPSGSDPIFYFTPPYFSPSVYPTPGGYVSPYTTPGGYVSPYVSPYVTPSVYPTPGTSGSGGQNTNVNQNQAQQQSATGGTSSATGGSSSSTATGGGGGEGGDAGVARVQSDSRSTSSTTASGGTSTVSITNNPSPRPNPTSEVRVVTQAQQPRVAGVTATTITELPKTGLPLLAWAAASFLPMGFGLKRFTKGISEDCSNSPDYIWQVKRFKSHKS